MKRYGIAFLSVCLLAAVGGCDNKQPANVVAGASMDVCAVALTSSTPLDDWDHRIAKLQARVGSTETPVAHLDQLGWAFVAKARVSFDPGYYRLAELAARCMDTYRPESSESLLLRGHVLHQLHEFAPAETLARRLVAQRGLSFDYGLLGDVLLEQGKLTAAAEAYQTMMDQKPSPRAYIRAAQIRWLTGDLPGAIDAMETSVASGATRDVESAAWAHVRLANYRLQAGEQAAAEGHLEAAIALQPGYAPALLTQGRLWLSQGKLDDAIESLTRAAEINPLPEYWWVLIEALEQGARHDEAAKIERRLMVEGPTEDPRTFAMYLATRGQDIDTALRLAEEELETRSDVHTLDAVSWALLTAGNANEAAQFMERALAEGTRDARLFLHAGVIAAAVGDEQSATSYLSQAATMEQTLLPSERARLHKEIAAL